MDTILLVDTYPIATYGLTKALRDAGINNPVEQAHTIPQAQRALAGRLDLLVYDPTMPGVAPNLFIVLARLKHPELPVLFFSSQFDDVHLALAQMLGVNGYLDKTCDLPVLISTIRNVLDGAHCFPPQSDYSSAENQKNPCAYIGDSKP